MGISTERDGRQQLIFFSIVLMLVALFTSRVLLSSAMIAFLFFTCFHKNIIPQLRIFVSNRFLTGLSLLFLIPFVTWFWSNDQQEWARWARIKLPLFLLPVAFAGKWQLNPRQWRWMISIFLLLLFAGCCQSLFYYLQDARAIQDSYLRAKIMRTPLGNDHVRFSLLVCIAAIVSVMGFINKNTIRLRALMAMLAIFFIVYLHILSARTGLVGFYLFVAAGILYLIIAGKNKKRLALISLGVVLMPLAAWFLLPTFQNRIRYLVYDFSFIRNDTYLAGSSDGSRALSMRAGWDIFIENPGGVGSGDVMNKTNAWYTAHVPQMLETDKLYPSSEWLLYGDAAGWIGLIGFTVIMLLPMFEKIFRNRFYWIMMNAVMAGSFLFDIGLENQFGVFIYGFVVLAWWKYARERYAPVEAPALQNHN